MLYNIHSCYIIIIDRSKLCIRYLGTMVSLDVWANEIVEMDSPTDEADY